MPKTARYLPGTTVMAVLLGILVTIPLWRPAIPPLIDLPGHMGRYRIMLAQGMVPSLDTAFGFHWQLIGNLGADLLIVPLAAVFGLEPAVKIMVILIAVLSVSGLILVARVVHGRLPATVLFAAPLVYSYPFQFGFLNFVLSVALALNALALWLWLAKRGRYGTRVVAFALLAWPLWLAHASGLGLFGIAAFGSEVARRRGLDEGWPRAVALAVATCLPMALPLATSALLLAGVADAPTKYFFDPKLKLAWLLSLLREADFAYDVASAGVLVVVVVVALVSRRFVASALLFWPSLLCALAFALLPLMLFGSSYADMRVLPFMAILGLLAIDVRGAQPRTTMIFTGAAAAFLAARLITTTLNFADLDARWRAELVALDHLPRGAPTLVLSARVCLTAWHTPRLDHVGSLAIVRRDAFVNTQFAVEGAQLLKIRQRNTGFFRRNPSQIILPPSCTKPEYAKFDPAIAAFNRAAFAYVWTIGFPPGRAQAADLRVAWTNGTSTLYRVDRSALQQGRGDPN